MIIMFEDENLRKDMNLESRLSRKWGKKRRDKIRARMAQLRAAACLADMKEVPGAYLEELSYRPNDHHFTVRLDNPWRILFEPADVPLPVHPGGNVDWTRVTAIRILVVGDTHGE